MRTRFALLVTIFALCASAAHAERYYLVTGADARHYPGPGRMLFGPGGVPGTIYDGDRLAGTSPVGPIVNYQGSPGTYPMYEPNHLGALSMLFRRGTIPYAGGIPFLGIEFLGGVLLDLDGDLNNGGRSLIPVPPATPVEIPATDSFLALTPDFAGQTIGLADCDVTGCNEGAPNLGPDLATILVTIAGTQADGGKSGPINPSIDTRTGTLTAYTGNSGTLAGVYRVADLGYELWEDSIDPYTSSPDVLGSMQFLGTFRGWLVQRDPDNGLFPVLAGEGLGTTLWPAADLAHIGQTYVTANGLAGGSALIRSGAGGDDYTAAGNGGLVLTDYAGDLGAYLDAQVVPRLPITATRFAYLESAGFGINNSFDPVFTDTVGYDVVVVAATGFCAPYEAGDVDCSGGVDFEDINPFVAALSGGEAAWQTTLPPEATCSYLCVCDLNRDGVVDFNDINPFIDALSGQL